MAKELQKYSSPDDSVGKSGIFPRAEKSNFSYIRGFLLSRLEMGSCFLCLCFLLSLEFFCIAVCAGSSGCTFVCGTT